MSALVGAVRARGAAGVRAGTFGVEGVGAFAPLDLPRRGAADGLAALVDVRLGVRAVVVLAAGSAALGAAFPADFFRGSPPFFAAVSSPPGPAGAGADAPGEALALGSTVRGRLASAGASVR